MTGFWCDQACAALPLCHDFLRSRVVGSRPVLNIISRSVYNLDLVPFCFQSQMLCQHAKEQGAAKEGLYAQEKSPTFYVNRCYTEDTILDKMRGNPGTMHCLSTCAINNWLNDPWSKRSLKARSVGSLVELWSSSCKFNLFHTCHGCCGNWVHLIDGNVQKCRLMKQMAQISPWSNQWTTTSFNWKADSYCPARAQPSAIHSPIFWKTLHTHYFMGWW